MNKSSDNNKGNNFTTEVDKYKNVKESDNPTSPKQLSMATKSGWSFNTIIIRNDSAAFNYDGIHFNDTNAGLDNNTISSDAATVVNLTSRTGTNAVIVVGSNASNNGSDVNIENLENYKYWSEIVLIICFCLFIIITVIGNTLVILSVITTRRLRTVTNCFVMSLAVADWLVGVFVMPPAVAVYAMGSWQLGWILCELWISLDVLLCTASILSLCAISIDRYLAVTQPLNYSRRRRSKRLALIMILIVWVLALAITCPPLIGWYEYGRRDNDKECRYNENKGYVVFSAMGSFYVPMIVMVYVYLRISCVVARRHEQMTDIEMHKKKTRTPIECQHYTDNEMDGEISDNDQCPSTPTRRKLGGDSNQPSINNITELTNIDSIKSGNNRNNGHYDLMDASTPTSKRSSTVTYKISNSSDTWPSVHQPLHHHHHQHHQQHHQRQASVRNNDLTSKNIRIHQTSVSTRITSMRRENKTTQTLSIVVGGFVACWLPFFIVYLATPFIGHGKISENIKVFLTWLGWVNSAINPFIYAFYSVDFRAAFWRLTLRRFFKNTRQLPPYGNTAMSIRR